MSFWDLSDGESANSGQKEFEQPTSNFDPIPDGAKVLAEIDEVKWDYTRDNNEYLSIRWAVQEPEEFAKRKIFQKLWVTDADPNAKDAEKAKKKSDNAKRMLAAIDANCGGKLSKLTKKPSNDELTMALTARPLIIKCQVWEMKTATGETNTGNWISAVFPRQTGVDVPAGKPAPKGGSAKDDLGDDIPF